MTDASLLVSLALLGFAAVAFFPGMMWAYWAIVLPRRLDDIVTNIWNEKAIKSYVELFTREDADDYQRQIHKRYHDKPDQLRAAFERTIQAEFRAVHSKRNYILSVLPITLVVAAVAWTCCSWADARIAGSNRSVGQLDLAIIMALAGAYVWSIYEVLSRYRTRDLGPEDLLEMMLRHLAAVPIGYAFSLLAMGSVAPALAFASAAFPLRDLRLILRQRALKKIELSLVDGSRPTEGHLGKVLDGLGDATLARLEELQIVTYMDLAYINPIRLMAKTGYSLRQILAWIDQALLAVYAPQLKRQFTRAGLPCALDVSEFYLDHCYDAAAATERDWRHDEAVLELARVIDTPVVLVREMLKRVHEDPHVRFLAEVWYSRQTAAAT